MIRSIFRSGRFALSAGLLVALPALVVGLELSVQAARVARGNGPQLLIGFDDDNQANALIQCGRATGVWLPSPLFGFPRFPRGLAPADISARGNLCPCGGRPFWPER